MGVIMKKILALMLLSYSILYAQNNFVRGIFLFDNIHVDFTQLHDSLHLNWIQAAVDNYDSTKFASVFNNSASLNINCLISDSTLVLFI